MHGQRRSLIVELILVTPLQGSVESLLLTIQSLTLLILESSVKGRDIEKGEAKDKR